MSFRKRSEIIGAAGGPGAARGPVPIARGAGISGVGPGTARGIPPATGRPIAGRSGVSPIAGRSGMSGSPGPSEKNQIELVMQNPGVTPSIITSQPTVSTGSPDLDKILQHQGLPTGSSLLIEESGTTDFASVLLRAFASQGVMHNRINKETAYSHVVVIGMSSLWANELPGLYKGSSKEQKKAKIKEKESQISVSNLTNQDMKIAWRYGINNKKQEAEAEQGDQQQVYEHYNNQFDITQKLVPGPSAQDISFIPLSANYNQIIHQLNSIITNQLRNNQGKTVRIIIPNLLNPSIYPPAFSAPSFIIPFLHSIRAVLAKNPHNLSLILSLPLDLYPRYTSLTLTLEIICDSVIHLQPFNQEMSALIEKAYKNEPAKIQQGLVNIVKLPVLSDKGMMMIYEGEYAFKNGRKKFEIEEWGIPVEDDGGDESQTTKSIDF